MIFLARICDVSIGTIRIIFVSKGNKKIAPILGFFEVLIWITAISKIMQNLDNYVNYFAYAAGFATGNFVRYDDRGKLAMGIQMIRIITHQSGIELAQSINKKDTELPALKHRSKGESTSHLFNSSASGAGQGHRDNKLCKPKGILYY